MTSTINEVVVFLSRWMELSVPGKATILLTLGLVAAHFAVRSRAAVRHIILAATFAALASLPAIAVAGLRLPVAVVVSRGGVSVPAASSATSFGPAQGVFGNNSVPRPAAGSESNIPRWLTIVRFLWIAGSVIFALPLAVDLWRLRRLRRDWLPWPELRQPALALAAERGVRHRVEVLLHEEIPAPLTCGLWHPAIALPWDARDWKEAELRRSLVHELEHVRRRDWAVHLAARATCAFYWFHPLVWVAWRRLCLEAERACDDAVIQKEDGTEYAGQLVSLARRMSTVQARPALGMANRSDLARRVSAILDHRQRRGRAEILAAGAS